MRLLHTSDWHLGRCLYGQKRDREFSCFLDWLFTLISTEKIDVLIVAGDIFDTNNPNIKAQQMYYGFLSRVCLSTPCQIVVIGGNHDSPSFLEAPKELLQTLNVHVVGQTTEKPKDELLLLRKQNGEPLAIICAVPFLREKDLRQQRDTLDLAHRAMDLQQALAEHYNSITQSALELRSNLKLKSTIPIIATGHLFMQGGNVTEGDGVRELYVGNLWQTPSQIFSKELDYVALGHLHLAQMVGQNPAIRYSGSPLPMCFGEVDQKKYVNLVEFQPGGIVVTPKEVPIFQKLVKIVGDKPKILAQLANICATNEPTWVEIQYQGPAGEDNLAELFASAAENRQVSILRITVTYSQNMRLHSKFLGEKLETLLPEEVFERCLTHNAVPENDKPGLRQAYGEILQSIFTAK